MPEPVASRVVFAGRYLTVVAETWPDIGEWEVLHKRSAVAIVPITPDGQVVLVRQFRIPVRQELVEVPAGLLDIHGEDARTCAIRELFEETGYRAHDVRFLGGVFMSPGATDEYVHFFVGGTDAEPAGSPEEGIQVILRPFEEMVRAARTGRVRDAMSALALVLAAAQPSSA
ncbi:MAG: NUDIX hydrolase [Actinobacteria bacterium]|nr:MAG: NUDIX hydrolase [Actinomycetota bacterium]